MKLNPDIKVTAVVCCYHGVKTVYNALSSLDKQSIEKKYYEIIVVDNGSIDGSSSEIERFVSDHNPPNVKVFKISNEGLSNARNVGYNKAKGDFIFYMDDDAYADEMCLEFILNSFISNPNTNVLGGTVGILNDKNKFAYLYHNSIFRYWMEDVGIIIGTNMSFRKSLLSKSEGFIKDLKYRGDESAFFEKNKEIIVSKIDNSVVVYHTQPERLKSFLRSRLENGEAKAFLRLSFNNIKSIDKRKNSFMFVIRFFSSGIGFLIAVFACFSLNLNLSCILMLGILFTIRFLFHHDLRGSLKVYSKTKHNSYNVLHYFYIIFIVTIGSLLEDLGYVLSFLRLTLKRSKRK